MEHALQVFFFVVDRDRGQDLHHALLELSTILTGR
jgi:hypothetical protein